MTVKNFFTVSIAALTLLSCKTNTKENMSTLNLTGEWDKTFPKSELVNHCKVTFHNRYGIELAADMYVPGSFAGAQCGKLPAIAVSGPFGAVKEQSSGLYAQHMAERGFVAIAFDPSFTGESGGEPRRMASPDINTEDFLAAVDFLSNCDIVDPERIGGGARSPHQGYCGLYYVRYEQGECRRVFCRRRYTGSAYGEAQGPCSAAY